MQVQDLNPHNVKVGKEYWVRYVPANSPWKKIKITRFTEQGHPWQEGEECSGILTDSYEVSIGVPEDIKRGDYYREQKSRATEFFEEYPEELIALAKRKGLITQH